MRFAQLELIRYGRFEDCYLRFPRSASDLHVIFGGNEAGKSTTMAAINDLLFGFPHITTNDFRFDKQLLRVGAVIETGEVELTCRRKKGRVGTLLDSEEHVLDEGRLASMLSGHTSDSYQRMFSLDHSRLEEGGRAILAAQDDIGQAIFAAGAGLVSVAAVLEGLEADSKEIWTKRAGDRRYYAAQHAYDDARARQKAGQIKPAAWDDLRQELVRLDAEIEHHKRRRSDLEREREEVERRRRVLPHAALYARAQAELEPLTDAPELPADAGETLRQIATDLAGADAEATLAQAERDRVQALLDALVVDVRTIERRDEIEALRETKGAVDKSLSDLPRRRTELTTRGRRLAELQRELAWPTDAASVVKAQLPQRVLLAELRSLLETRSALDATLLSAETDEITASEAQARLQARVEALPPARDLGALSAALKFARGLGDVEAAVRTSRREVDRRSAALTASLAQLAPWSGNVSALRSLVVPDDSETAGAISEAARAATALADLRRDHQAELDRKGALELQRTHLVRDDSAIPADAISAARGKRDALWLEVRAHIVDGVVLPDPGATAEDLERGTATADDVADRRYTAAEQSARLAALQEDLERNDLSRNQLELRMGLAEAEVAAASATWQGLLAPSGLQLDPKGFSAWSERRRRALEIADELSLAEAAEQEVLRQRDDATVRVTGALARAGAPPIGDETFDLLLETAERLETVEIEVSQDRRDLAAELALANEARQRAATKAVAARGGLTGWDARWTTAVAAAGLNPERPQAIIRAQLDLLEELRSEVDEILSLQQRVAAIEADIDAFGEQVATLGLACGLPIAEHAPGKLLIELAAAARDAAAAQARRSDLTDQLVIAERRVADAATAKAHALARLQPLLEAAGAPDRTVLAESIQRADRARHLRQETDRLAAEILGAAAGFSLDALLAESVDIDSTTLVVRSGELQEALAELSEAIARLTGDRATANAAFAQLDDGPDAAIAAADAEQARAEMAVQAEAYVRKRAEVALLRWTISRYRTQRQTPLLKRASNLFSKLTLGRYVELLVEVDNDKARLAGLGQDQSVVPVEVMSEGTVDQLFMALRIAAVEDAVRAGAVLPFIADDLFVNYDDRRARAGFQVLAELAQTTQVLFFTHHQHLVALAEESLAPLAVSKCELA